MFCFSMSDITNMSEQVYLVIKIDKTVFLSIKAYWVKIIDQMSQMVFHLFNFNKEISYPIQPDIYNSLRD